MDNKTYETIINRTKRNQIRKMKRIRQLRRRVGLALLTLFLVTVLAVSYHAILSEANTKDKEPMFKYYTSIEVVYGDTLWSIADEYADKDYVSVKDYVEEIMQINHMKEESIIAGQYLVVPYYSKEFK